MKQGRTLTELAQEIERQQVAKRDYLADTRSVAIEPTSEGGVVLAASDIGRFPINAHAHNQIGARVGIPTKYYNRMLEDSPALLANNVNHWLRAEPEKRLLRTLDGNLRAFLSNRYQRIDNNRVADTVLPVLQEINSTIGGLRVASCEITENRLYLKVVFDGLQMEIPKRVGDVVACGVMITNSEVGMGALGVAQFFDRLRCTNGMITSDLRRRFNHVGKARDTLDVIDYDELLSDETKRLEDATALSKVRDVVKAALDFNKFREQIEKLGATTEQKIEGDPVKAIELLSDTFDFNESERGSVLRHLIEGGELSRFGMIQAVTRTAEDLPSYDRATQFEAFGGSLLALPSREWAAIAGAK